jgi:hypothetical protein
MTKLKFETEDSNFGLTQARGFAWHNHEGLMFEFQVLDSILEVVKSEVKELFVSYNQIEKIYYEKEWFSGGFVYIELNSLKNLDKIPFLEETELCLELERKEKDKGKEFAVNAQLALSNYRLNQMDNDN